MSFPRSLCLLSGSLCHNKYQVHDFPALRLQKIISGAFTDTGTPENALTPNDRLRTFNIDFDSRVKSFVLKLRTFAREHHSRINCFASTTIVLLLDEYAMHLTLQVAFFDQLIRLRFTW